MTSWRHFQGMSSAMDSGVCPKSSRNFLAERHRERQYVRAAQWWLDIDLQPSSGKHSSVTARGHTIRCHRRSYGDSAQRYRHRVPDHRLQIHVQLGCEVAGCRSIPSAGDHQWQSGCRTGGSLHSEIASKAEQERRFRSRSAFFCLLIVEVFERGNAGPSRINCHSSSPCQ
jgi:hypothetical protein